MKKILEKKQELTLREESVKKREEHLDKILNVETEQRFRDIGILMSLIHTTEYHLRFYLYRCKDKFKGNKKMFMDKKVHEYKVGEIMPDNAFSNFMSLNDLLKEYNDIVKEEYKIDETIINIRDNLAHGRFMDENNPLRLIKTNKRREVTINEVIDEKFMKKNVEILKKDYSKLRDAIINQQTSN